MGLLISWSSRAEPEAIRLHFDRRYSAWALSADVLKESDRFSFTTSLFILSATGSTLVTRALASSHGKGYGDERYSKKKTWLRSPSRAGRLYRKGYTAGHVLRLQKKYLTDPTGEGAVSRIVFGRAGNRSRTGCCGSADHGDAWGVFKFLADCETLNPSASRLPRRKYKGRIQRSGSIEHQGDHEMSFIVCPGLEPN